MNLIHHLSVGRKLVVLGLLVLATVCVPLYLQLKLSRELIEAADGERRGVDPARKLMKLVQLTQHHRGLSAGVLGGNAALVGKRDEKKQEVAAALGQLDERLKHEALAPGLAQVWKQAGDDWRALESAVDGRRLSAADSSSRHAQLIARYFQVLDLLLDHTGLILDPQADTYYLMSAALTKLPLATEALGQTRARGAGFLAERSVSPEGRATVAGLTRASSDQYESMTNAFAKAFAANPEFKQALSERLQQVREPMQSSLALAQREVVARESLQYPAPQYIESFTRTIDLLFGLEEASLASLEEALAERVSELRRTQWLTFGLLGVMIAGVALLARQVARSITQPLGRAVQLAERVAAGDLTGDDEVRGRDEIAKLMAALKAMKDSLHRIVAEVRGNAEGVAIASREIAQGNADLSRRTEQQAASLQQTASSMEQLTSTVGHNADNAREANTLAQQARELAQRGGSSVQQMVSTMHDIEAGSRRIADIIGVIDGIAFQTNILALNAAVEAARAGEQGRGFAVVAAEVRSLAQRSAEAAREIKSLIGASVTQVGNGTRVVQEAGATMDEAVQAIEHVAIAISQITTASDEQRSGIGQISTTVQHMDELTQQNAALVEQAAAASERLDEQAGRLAKMVNTFRLQPSETAAPTLA
ncbi:MAG TPA: methyl-accepting chemotaxis protein [Burkholderiaceae bacterium]|nr:methyl-accepting chemotaxis protein [Burkholderiaceae bacterium]